MFKTVGSMSRLDFTRTRSSGSNQKKNTIGFLIFAFVLEIRQTLLPHALLWGVMATPNQHLLTLPSSPVGKSSDLHAGVQQFKSHSGHTFFFFLHTYYPVPTHSPISDNFST